MMSDDVPVERESTDDERLVKCGERESVPRVTL
jgi:hypothetical protein